MATKSKKITNTMVDLDVLVKEYQFKLRKIEQEAIKKINAIVKIAETRKINQITKTLKG